MEKNMENSHSYIPLHVHSCYSINDGLQNVGDIVSKAAKLKIPALAVTDFNNMAGFIRFYNECNKKGIKPIMGADLKVKEDTKPGEPEKYFMVTLLATNRIGKQNLYDILSDAWINTASPDISDVAASVNDLFKYAEGLILLDGFNGDIANFIREDEKQKLKNRLEKYIKHYGDRFCFEITRTNRAGEGEFEVAALNLCSKYQIAPVATNDTRFLLGPNETPQDGFSDYYVHDIRVAIQKGCQKGDAENARLYSEEQYLRSPQEMEELFYDLPEALINTRQIAERCNVEIELDVPRLPRYDTGELSSADCLRMKAREGLEERLKFLFPDEKIREEKRPIYEARLERELEVIIKMDFPGYFLIVMEFIQWSKANGVPVGPGRGSGGGSLVAYALTITDFDPLRFDLLFERFLNPERVSMPDFDVDFCQRKRALTLQHVVDHYGRNAVSQIAAFGTLAPKAAIQGVGRAIGIPLGQVRRVAGLIPEKPGTTFNACFGIDPKKPNEKLEPASPDFVAMYNRAKLSDDKETIELIDVSRRLEGVIRSIGKHAAGVVISPTRIAEFAPLMLDSDGNPITQYDKKDVEHAGLVKFDFLGLTTLTIIDDAKQMIDEKRKKKGLPPINIAAIPYEDDASYKMIQETETTAVFQLESTGMRNLIGRMQPDRFEDLVALVALYRPGPLNSGMADHFVLRKRGLEPISYPLAEAQDMDLKPVLDATYGVILYQEQVMQIAQVLAGYSLGGADILRRAMGKKELSVMAVQREVFNKGCAKRGKDLAIMGKIFDGVQEFAQYGFNKSHSAAYALVAWWTLYLKVHYPAEFLAAMMTADCMKTEKLIAYIGECHRLGVKVNPPDVNVGKFHFGVDDDGNVIYGFSAIKGVGEKLVDHIVEERNAHGKFIDYFDFVYRVGKDYISKGTLEAFIKSGALDSIGTNRAQMLASIPVALSYAAQKANNIETGQTDLFSCLDDTNVKPNYIQVVEWSDKIRLYHEKNILGLYLSGHPINAYKPELIRYCGDTTLNNMLPGSKDKPAVFTVGGVVIESSCLQSKKNASKSFYALTLDDGTGTFEICLFDKLADKYREVERKHNEEKPAKKKGPKSGNEKVPTPLILVVNALYYSTQEADNSVKLRFTVRSFSTLEELREHRTGKIIINLTSKTLEKNITSIDEIIMRNRLDVRYINQQLQMAENKEDVERGYSLNIIIDNKLIKLRNDLYRYRASDDLIESIRDIAGLQSVHVAIDSSYDYAG